MHRREHWWMAEAMRWRMETNFVINSTHSAGMQRARHTDKFKKWRRKNKELGRRRHDWRMDGSRSERETEKRERRSERESDSQSSDVSFIPYYLSGLCVHMFPFGVCVCTATCSVCVCVIVIDSSQPAACSKAKDFIINRTGFNLLLQAEWWCSLCSLLVQHTA